MKIKTLLLILINSSVLFNATQKITLEDLGGSRSALDEKSADYSHSVNSMQTATYENSNVAVYEVGHTHSHLIPAGPKTLSGEDMFGMDD